MSDLTREQVERYVGPCEGKCPGDCPAAEICYDTEDCDAHKLAAQLLTTMRENEALVAWVRDQPRCRLFCHGADVTCGSPECIAAIVADYEGRTHV
jgi:hypothetical protein